MRALFVLIGIGLSSIAWATEPGLGGVAENILGPVDIITQFVGSASIVVGICSLLASFLKYRQHRVNQLVAPLSTIVVLFLIGVALLLLPFVYKLTSSGIPYRFSF